jgi:RHH-type proline utilization regulon transcriptional repressor/proline dehydrogenase/delta 1-pyrroline-5-carboxylate dehydrogenase
MSGTGPKAGGPRYVARFRAAALGRGGEAEGAPAGPREVAEALRKAKPEAGRLSAAELPGPTGESNRLSVWPRGPVLCLGPGRAAAGEQARQARAAGCAAVELPGGATPEALAQAEGVAAVIWWGEADAARELRRALAGREGRLVPLVREAELESWLTLERHVCVDTTAAGGNAALLAASDG